MQVTEHNVVDWNLNEEELNALIKLSKEKAISCKQEEDRLDELFYGLIAGKLIIMKNEEKETAGNWILYCRLHAWWWRKMGLLFQL